MNITIKDQARLLSNAYHELLFCDLARKIDKIRDSALLKKYAKEGMALARILNEPNVISLIHFSNIMEDSENAV